ncbi:MAG: hypothetical protein M3N68_11060 [Actinomycetota bacterium]|nr:hypothetical protein [Actinomycetota bacterium]
MKLRQSGVSHPLAIMAATTTQGRLAVPSLTVSCSECSMQGTDTCQDCVVSFICGRDPDEAVIIDAEEERAVRLLANAGLVPRLRHQRAAR